MDNFFSPSTVSRSPHFSFRSCTNPPIMSNLVTNTCIDKASVIIISRRFVALLSMYTYSMHVAVTNGWTKFSSDIRGRSFLQLFCAGAESLLIPYLRKKLRNEFSFNHGQSSGEVYISLFIGKINLLSWKISRAQYQC